MTDFLRDTTESAEEKRQGCLLLLEGNLFLFIAVGIVFSRPFFPNRADLVWLSLSLSVHFIISSLRFLFREHRLRQEKQKQIQEAIDSWQNAEFIESTELPDDSNETT